MLKEWICSSPTILDAFQRRFRILLIELFDGAILKYRLCCVDKEACRQWKSPSLCAVVLSISVVFSPKISSVPDCVDEMQSLLSSGLLKRSRNGSLACPGLCCNFWRSFCQSAENASVTGAFTEFEQALGSSVSAESQAVIKKPVFTGGENLEMSYRSSKSEVLWAMERVSTLRRHLSGAMTGGMIPACVDRSVSGLPSIYAEGSFLIYLDRLQLHQFWWKMGNPRFFSSKFELEVYDRTWVYNHTKSIVICRVEVYPQVVNLTKVDEIINVTFVNPQKWGKRCPIVFCGEEQCIGLQKGGNLKRDLLYLAFRCSHDLVLPDIKVDVSNLDIGDRILIKDLNIDLELTSNLDPCTPICKII